jgi:hypothetical protein
MRIGLYIWLLNFFGGTSAYAIMVDNSLLKTNQKLRDLNNRLTFEIVDLRKECKKLRDFAGIWDNENPNAPHSTPFTLKESFLEKFNLD